MKQVKNFKCKLCGNPTKEFWGNRLRCNACYLTELVEREINGTSTNNNATKTHEDAPGREKPIKTIGEKGAGN
jgi:hypothetical protein